jgi:hypothetical protein
MSTPPLPDPGAAPVKKGKGPLFWILIGIGSLALLGMLMVGGLVFFGARVMQKAGVSISDFQKNPGMAAARMMVSANPDLEFVSENAAEGAITVREKSTGRVLTMRVDGSNGTLEVTDDQGRRFKMDGKTGKMVVEGDHGETAEFGTNLDAKLPGWVPAYPGSDPKGALSASNAEGQSLSITFETKDSAQKVMDFYEREFKSGGFTISNRTALPDGGMLIAQDAGQKRTAIITMDATGQVLIQTQEKN